jgi:hypothetical protein
VILGGLCGIHEPKGEKKVDGESLWHQQETISHTSSRCMNLHEFGSNAQAAFFHVTAWVTKWLNLGLFTISEPLSLHPFGLGAASQTNKTQQSKSNIATNTFTSRQECNHDCTMLAPCAAVSFCED